MKRALMLLVLTACGDGNSLGGSIGESFGLEFDEVEIHKVGDDLVIEYLREVSDPPEKVCKVVVEDTAELDLGDNTNLRGDTFLNYVTISRVTASGGDFPPVESGSLSFDEYALEDGAKVKGEFDAVFDNGRTINGEFSGEVQEISLE